MIEAQLKDINNNSTGIVELPDEIFGLEERVDIMHTAVVNYLANQRQGTHATKTRGLVSGGGKKPWRQKHTGRARHGSNRSPLWKGGGTTFGPLPRDYSAKLNKKVKRLAVKIALSSKLKSSELLIIDEIRFEKPSTKEMVAVLKRLNVDSKKVLIVLDEVEENIVLSARNIIGVTVTLYKNLNTYDILAHDFLIITRDTVDAIKKGMVA